jgi:hypothetical protein
LPGGFKIPGQLTLYGELAGDYSLTRFSVDNYERMLRLIAASFSDGAFDTLDNV